MNLYQRLAQALETPAPEEKCRQVRQLEHDWLENRLTRDEHYPLNDYDDVGRPDQPLLVDPRKLPRRSVASEEGRLLLLHSFAHIEFNAINIALDAAYRFRQMPDQYVSDWLRVAQEESKHFELLQQELIKRGSFYGAFPAHRGLWDMVCKTRHDVLHRMALVPRVMEARGLDVTPSMIARFRQHADQAAVDILEIIYHDEIDHVRIGNHWYHHLCQQRDIDPVTCFSGLVQTYLGDGLRGPFNYEGRLQAGFTESELNRLEQDRGMQG